VVQSQTMESKFVYNRLACFFEIIPMRLRKPMVLRNQIEISMEQLVNNFAPGLLLAASGA
jgi:hypothetical protein